MKNFLIFFIAIISIQLSAQTIDKIQLEKKLDSILQPFNIPNAPGGAITVVQNGEVITKKNFGLANLEHNIQFTHKSPVRLVYSMTREFMSVGLAIMEDEGLLRFDDKVRKYLPKLPEWSKDVTIQNLLNHSSGFDDEWSLGLLMHDDMRNRLDKEQALTWLYNQPKPQIEPGKGYMYCNTDYALIRLVMEIASKQSLPDYLKDKLFDPLGMVFTFMNDDIEAVIPGFAESYYGYKPFRKARFYKTSPGGNYRMVTTADDLENWLKSIEDPLSIVSKAFKRLYQDARPIPVVSPEQHYTFGHEWHKRDSIEFVYHGGVGESFYIFRIPSKGIAIISLGNGANNIWAMMQLAESFLPPKPISTFNAPIFPAEPIILTKKELAKFEGRYFKQKNKGYNSHIENISFYDIKQEGDSLNLYYSKDASIPITAFGNWLFKDMEENVPMQFTNINPDAPMKLTIWTPNGQILNYQREETKEKVNKVYLKQFQGQFYSPHLDYYFRIILNEEGQLVIKRPTVSDKIMETYGDNSFFFEGETGAYNFYTQATFTKNEKGEIDGFNLQDSRMMHHRFNKVK
jgi:CubicO group peptidase (beta-lactamase class C family)